MIIFEIIASLGAGGAETIVRDLSVELDNSQNTVHVLIVDRYSEQISERGKIDTLRKAGIAVHSLGRKPGHLDLNSFLRLQRLVSRYEPDVIHFHSFIAGLLLIPFMLLNKKASFFQTIHNSKNLLGRVPTAIQRHIFAQFCQLIYCSTAAKDNLEITYGPGEVISNGIRLTYGAINPDLKHTLNVPDHAVTVLSVGRICPQKNQLLLLDIIAEVNRLRMGRPFVFLLCGDTNNKEYFREFQKKVSSLSLSSSIRLLGVRPDIIDLMNSVDIFISTSDFEGLPITCLEAFSTGVQMVLSPIPEHTRVFEKQSHIFFPNDHKAKSYAQVISDLTYQRHKHRTREERQPLMQQYSIASTAKRHEEIFKHSSSVPWTR